MDLLGCLHPNIIRFSILCYTVCSATIIIPGDGTLILEGDTPLKLTCVNDLQTAVDFRFNSKLIGTCYKVFGCNSKDPNFAISGNRSSAPYTYNLHTVRNFNVAHCGTYRCSDIDNEIHDSIIVSFKGFDNNTFTTDEKNASLSITTSCTFHAALQDMTISWFYFDNSSLRYMDLSTVAEFSTTNVCPDSRCDSSLAENFTFGLNFIERPERFRLALIEIKVVYSQYVYKPLVWRSSKMYPVKDGFSENAQTQGYVERSILVVGITLAGACLLVVICLCKRKGWKMENCFISEGRTNRQDGISIENNSCVNSPLTNNDEEEHSTSNTNSQTREEHQTNVQQTSEDIPTALIHPHTIYENQKDLSIPQTNKGNQLDSNQPKESEEDPVCQHVPESSQEYQIHSKHPQIGEEIQTVQTHPLPSDEIQTDPTIPQTIKGKQLDSDQPKESEEDPAYQHVPESSQEYQIDSKHPQIGEEIQTVQTHTLPSDEIQTDPTIPQTIKGNQLDSDQQKESEEDPAYQIVP
ncbi:uncharacterized protein LOC128235187 [Mya arenaria]|uniref:uncharacterized protein LOC128235187 n=1 Tax=Mya arenaria TaxID=6604 RepID=UPI0022E6D939|nr:uncharacterized protein LOC128235187 [Mya arenaria]